MLSAIMRVVIVDLASGATIYVPISLLFGQNFDWLNLLKIMSFSLSPDLDFIPFILGNKWIFPWLKKKFRFASHHFIHFPLMFLPIGTAAAFWWNGYYGATLFLLAALAHFVHDTYKPPEEKSGIQWLRFLWFWKDLFYFHEGRIRRLLYEDWKQHLEERRKGAAARSMQDEVKMRADKFGAKSKIFIAGSVALLIVFSFLSR